MQPLPNRQQQFPHGFRLLLVGTDHTTLKDIENMCFRYNYNVTMCSEAAFAVNLLREKKECFDMVLSDDRMVDMDASEFIQYVVQETNLPVVVISSDERPNSVIKVLTIGACDYLIKPIREEVIKNIWKHVWQRHYKTQIEPQNLDNNMKNNDNNNSHINNSAAVANATALHDKTVREKGSVNEAPTRRSNTLMREEDDGELDNNDGPPAKKRRFIWTPELHDLFISAVQQLGLSKAVPKAILELMNVQGLTRENVASHLQKYRINLKRLYEEGHHHHQQTMNETPISTISGSPQSNLGRSQMESLAHVAPETVAVYHPNILAHHQPNPNVESSRWSHNFIPNVTVPSMGPNRAMSNLTQETKIPLNMLRFLDLHPQKGQGNLAEGTSLSSCPAGESNMHQQLQNFESGLSYGTKCDPNEVSLAAAPDRNQGYVIPNRIFPTEMEPFMNDLSHGNISGIHNSVNTLNEPNTSLMGNPGAGFLPDLQRDSNMDFLMDYFVDD